MVASPGSGNDRMVGRAGLTPFTEPGASDENRTRTVSLGICCIRWFFLLDLREGLLVSDRERPQATEVNGPLMARRRWCWSDRILETVTTTRSQTSSRQGGLVNYLVQQLCLFLIA